jgi:hypothetical protein
MSRILAFEYTDSEFSRAVITGRGALGRPVRNSKSKGQLRENEIGGEREGERERERERMRS